MDVEQIRGQIPTCQRMIYMNTGWSGPSPRTVVEAVGERLEYENYEGPTSKPVYESGNALRQTARECAASLLNVSVDEIALTQCTTDGLNTVINGLPWAQGDEVITFGIEHSSVLLPAYHLKERHGVKVKVLPLGPSDTAEDIVARVEAAISPRTRLLFFSHIQYTCGLRVPVEGLRELTLAKGVWMLIDGAQTAGHIALDLRALDVDFYSIPGQKWLLGPDGMGALYIRRDLIPVVRPWRVAGRSVLSYDDQGNFEANETSMEKFHLTTSSAPLAAGFAKAIQYHQAAGPGEVESRAMHLARRLKEALVEMPGVTVISPTEDSLSCGLTSFQVEGLTPDDAVARLWEQHSIVVRQVRELECVRASTHLFNTEGEVDALVGAMGGLVGA